LGVTAARGVLGRAVTVSGARTVTERLSDGTQVRVTIHPSLLLRLRTDAEKAANIPALSPTFAPLPPWSFRRMEIPDDMQQAHGFAPQWRQDLRRPAASMAR
jgi:hypothetical protein